MGLVLLSVALIPVGVLVSAARDSSLRRRPHFRTRFAGFLLAVTLPEFVIGLTFWAGILREQTTIALLLGLFWGLGLLPLATLVLFHGPGLDPGQSDEGGEGPDWGDDPPSPTPPPIGGLPLPDAQQASFRLRGPRPHRRSLITRRRTREPARSPTRVPPVRSAA